MDDLSVEAGGWLQVLKKHGEELSNTQIAVLKAEGDEKTKLLENVTKLDEHKTILVDRLKLVMEEYRSKGGKVDDYEAYIKAVSGVDVKISDASASEDIRCQRHLDCDFRLVKIDSRRSAVAQKCFVFFSYRAGCLVSGSIAQ
jgi:hypothetical protein